MSHSTAILSAFLAHQEGRVAEAEGAYRQILSADPAHADAHHLLGVLLHQSGRHTEARQTIEQAIALTPTRWEFHSNLGCVYQALGQQPQAVEAHRRAIELAPSRAHLYCNLGTALHDAGQRSAAAAAYRQAIAIAPQLSEAHYNLANLLREDHRIGEARQEYQATLIAAPEHLSAQLNLARLEADQQQWLAAYQAYGRARSLSPCRADVHVGLAVAARQLGRRDEAHQALEQAIALDPSHAAAHALRAEWLLQEGRWSEGWPEFERFSTAAETLRGPAPGIPLWNGEPLADGMLGVYCEGPIEEQWLLLTCLPQLLRHVAACAVECESAWVPLLHRSLSANIHAREHWDLPSWGSDQSRITRQVSLRALGRWFRAAEGSFPQPAAIVRAEAEQRQRWREKLAQLGGGPRIGIAWLSSRTTPMEQTILKNLESWLPLLRQTGVQWINLQAEATPGMLREFQTRFGVEIIDHPDHDLWHDWDGLAAKMSALDLVISADNPIAHLAGALGLDVRVVLAESPAWYWFIERADSPWYPRVQLSRTSHEHPLPRSLETLREALAGQFRLSAIGPSPARDAVNVAQRTRCKAEGTQAPAGAISAAGWDIARLSSAFREGKRLEDQQQWDAAEALYQQILDANPSQSEAWHRIGVCSLRTKRLPEAIERLERSVEADPNEPVRLFHYSVALDESGRREEAATQLRRALRIRPEFAEAHLNLGAILEMLSRHDEALTYCRRAADLLPDNSASLYNLANVQLHLGHVREATTAYERALQLEPGFAKAHWNRAMCLLLTRRFREGWEEWEWRDRAEEVVVDRYPFPEWRGESLASKTLLVGAEQGIGDEIMFASCFPDVIPTAGHVVITCAPRLECLFRRSFPTTTVIPIDRPVADLAAFSRDRLPPIDVYLSAGSLPRFFRPEVASFPRRRRFLWADPEQTALWRERYEQLGPGIKVGIAWRAGGKASEQKRRTSPIEDWGPILSVPGVHFINLQYGDCTRDLAIAREKLGVIIHDWPDANPLKNLEGFAAQVAALDHVISIGNTTIHMAGALGVPTWTLLPKVPGWRYMIDTEELLWYQSVRLFRQPRAGDWDSLFQQQAAALAVLSTGFAPITDAPLPRPVSSPNRRSVPVALTPAANLEEEARTIDALLRTGMQQHRDGDLGQAEATYRRVLEFNPKHADALQLLGVIASVTGRPELAIDTMTRSLAQDTQQPKVYYNLGNVLLSVGRKEEGLAALRRAVELQADLPEAHLNLGAAYHRQGLLDEAIQSYRRALDCRPNYAEAHHNIGFALAAQGHWAAALDRYDAALQVRPNYIEAHLHRGELLGQLGLHEEALREIGIVIEQRPQDAAVHLRRAEILLRAGQEQEGWKEREWRLAGRRAPERMNQDIPVWQGEALQGKRLLVAWEDDIETALLATAELHRLVAEAGHCRIETDRRLLRLWQRTLTPAEVIENLPAAGPITKPPGHFDFQIAVPSLWSRRVTRLPTGAADSRLQVDFALRKQCADRLAGWGQGHKIGLACTPAANASVRPRAIPLDHWASLLRASSVQFFALDGRETLDALRHLREPGGATLNPLPLRGDSADWDELAAWLSALDLVIAADNTVAHLAAALGVPTWVILGTDASWRWFVRQRAGGAASTLRLFVQNEYDRWDELLSSVWEALRSAEATGRVIPRPHLWHTADVSHPAATDRARN